MARLLLLPLLWLAVTLPGVRLLEDTMLAVEEPLSLHCGHSVVAGPDPVVLQSQAIRVALATDEEWREVVPDPYGVQARRTLAEAGSLFRSVGLYFLPVRVLELETSDHLNTAGELLDEVEAVSLNGKFDIVILLTAQSRSTSQDGRAVQGGRHAVVAHHKEAPQRDALVLAHEIGHLFGAHHGCDVPGKGGLMQRGGFDGGDLICPCTRRVLEMNAYRFHTDQP